jgi:hypothetical protein
MRVLDILGRRQCHNTAVIDTGVSCYANRDASSNKSYSALAASSGIPKSTLWHHAHGRRSWKAKAASQQYLTPTPQEEKALVEYLLQACRNGYPLPVKAVRTLAYVIARQRRQRSSPGQVDDVRPPNPNWPQAFLKRHPELKSTRIKALDANRHDHHIYHKVEEWFRLMGEQLGNPDILPENMYNMDETGVLLSVLNTLKVLISSDELRPYRKVGANRTLVTAIECISANGRSLPPLIIWPAATHRSTWTTFPTPGWHYACSKTGYTDTKISLYWIQNVFDPLTRDRANGKPQILINDGFGTHESLELMTFCFENNIVLCRLPSHTSHKLQPCDVGVFGPLKVAYRDQVEKLYRGGANTIGKGHFTELYDKARKIMTEPIIRAAWSRSGLVPFNPDKVLKEIQKPPTENRHPTIRIEENRALSFPEIIQTPTTLQDLTLLRQKIEQAGDSPGGPSKLCVEKISNAAEKALAISALLSELNDDLRQQNDERKCRRSARSTVVGNARILSYEAILEAEKRREENMAKVAASVPRKSNRRSLPSPPAQTKRSRRTESEDAEVQIRALGLEDYCSVLQF